MNHIQYTEYFRLERIVTTTENSMLFEKNRYGCGFYTANFLHWDISTSVFRTQFVNVKNILYRLQPANQAVSKPSHNVN